MAIHCFYEDFFAFLKALGLGDEDPWELYQKLYFHPHRDFFGAYWKTFFPQIDLRTLQDRVRQVRPGHYAALEHLVRQRKPEAIVEEVVRSCLDLLPRFPEPDVYLMVGFFSADGFIVEVAGWPAIGIGLERFKDFRLLDIIIAHEYCHYARRLALGTSPAPDQETLGQKLFSEGLSVAFSRRLFPRRNLEDHLLISRRRFNWCRQNDDLLESLARPKLHSSSMVPVFFHQGKPEEDIPPRTGMYLGHRLVDRALQGRGEGAFEELLSAPDITVVWPSGEQQE